MTGRRAAQRAETDARIMEAARAQLRSVGADRLSLRSVARDVGLVSSAVYRYVASRDALLTRLISDAYDSMGDAVESAIEAGSGDLDRWVAGALAVRAWAVERPHEYLLLYGTPIPGYEAPDDTVQPGTRVVRALAQVADDAASAGRLVSASATVPTVDPVDTVDSDDRLGRELRQLAATAGTHLDGRTVAALIIGWTQLFGLVGFEITNQTRGFVTDHEALLTACATRTGWAIGLR